MHLDTRWVLMRRNRRKDFQRPLTKNTKKFYHSGAFPFKKNQVGSSFICLRHNGKCLASKLPSCTAQALYLGRHGPGRAEIALLHRRGATKCAAPMLAALSIQYAAPRCIGVVHTRPACRCNLRSTCGGRWTGRSRHTRALRSTSAETLRAMREWSRRPRQSTRVRAAQRS